MDEVENLAYGEIFSHLWTIAGRKHRKNARIDPRTFFARFRNCQGSEKTDGLECIGRSLRSYIPNFSSIEAKLMVLEPLEVGLEKLADVHVV